ncbi:MAG: hypothetical protein ACOYB1_00235 [Limnohabitans sp.]
MTKAICFKCGEEKASPLMTCPSCKETPKHQSALALSLALSDHLSTKAQLAHYAHEIKNHLRLSVRSDHLDQANEALKDPQLIAMLGGVIQESARSVDAGATPRAAASVPSNNRPRQTSRSLSMKSSKLHSTPFALLGVTSRDDRRKIVDQAEHKSLELNPDDCQKARSDLTNPRNRLTAEIAWLPGVSPRRASQLLDGLLADAMAIRGETGLPTLAHCNLLAAAFEAIPSSHPPEDVAEFIQELAVLVGDLDVDEVIRDINEDRTISGFPEVKGSDQVEAELAERKRYFRTAIKDALNRLPPESLLAAITAAVDGATCGGEDHAPELLDELVDGYAVEVQSVLEKEAETAKRLIESVRQAASGGESATAPLVDKLERVARNWDRFAQPIQLSAKARGIDHDASNTLAYAIRSLAIDLFNEHDQINQSRRLTKLLGEIFSELPEFAERVDQDSSTLSDIHSKRTRAEAQSKEREAEWTRAITFSADVGVVFKDTLSISQNGIEWKGQRYQLESVTAVRWGALRHSVNGIPTGTDYEIAFATRSGATSISLRKESTYSGFIEALWRAVCVRLMIEMSEALEAGKVLSFGDMTVEDRYVTLVKHKFLGANEKVRLSWSDVHVWSANGEFVIGSKADKKIYGSGSYKDHWNIHLLDHVVRSGFKKGVDKLSDYFKN